jgi:hypothetical protein
MSKTNDTLVTVSDILLGIKSISDLFWSFVDIRTENECWEWLGQKKLSGYGHFGIGDRFLRAHRVALILEGRDLKSEQVVMHLCDNRACCNPKHLKAGSQKENLIDMRKKGRGVDPPIKRGENNSSAILTAEQVIVIRNSPLKGAELSKLFGVAQTTISSIKHRKIWKHV